MPAGDGDSGPDTVAMQEDCGRDGEFVILPSGSRKGSHRRQAGEDVRTGDAALRVGSRLRPQEIGLASALGVTRLSVHRRLRIAVFSTGDELVEAGVPLGPGQIHDSNRHTLSALLVGLGAEITDLGILRDSEAQIRARLADSAREHDAIVTSGGMSTGEEDHVKAAVDGIGRLHAWRLAIKPGRPVALGQIGRVPFIGLPGNPVAVMVTFLLLARPLLLRLAGAEPKEPPRYRVVAGFDYTKKAGRREFLRARLEAAAGGPVARRFERDGAGILSSLTQSDGLIELPEELTHLASGSPVDYLPYNEVLS
jgi:molybdopterin molybdotransferase